VADPATFLHNFARDDLRLALNEVNEACSDPIKRLLIRCGGAVAIIK